MTPVYTDAELVAEVRRVASMLPEGALTASRFRTPTLAEMDLPSTITSGTYRRRFGDLTHARDAPKTWPSPQSETPVSESGSQLIKRRVSSLRSGPRRLTSGPLELQPYLPQAFSMPTADARVHQLLAGTHRESRRWRPHRRRLTECREPRLNRPTHV